MGFTEIWWGIGFPIFLAAIGLATYLATSDSSASEFWIARIAYTLGTFDVLGFLTFWLWFVLRWVPLFRLVLGVAASVVLLLGLSSTFEWVNLEEVRLSETLASKNVETPVVPASCSQIPPGAVMIFMGSNLALATKMPATVVKMGDSDLLVVDIYRGHRLRIDTLRLLNENNEEIARIDGDEFWTAPSVRHEKPDASTLVIYDQNNAEVLRISYLNVQAIVIRGKFRAEDHPPLFIGEDKAELGDRTFEDACLGELGGGEVFHAE